MHSPGSSSSSASASAPSTNARRQAMLATLLLAATASSLLLFTSQVRPVRITIVANEVDLDSDQSRAFEYLDVASADIVVENMTLFFVESNVRRTRFHPLTECAFESAAKHNPDTRVVVLVDAATNIGSPPAHLSPDVFPNLRFAKVNFSRVVEDTPVEGLWKSRRFAHSTYRLFFMSDILRVALLFKFGGTYMDSDIVSLRRLPVKGELPANNYIVAEDETSVNNAPRRFRSTEWAVTGPKLLTSAVRHSCHFKPEVLLENVTCGDFAVLPMKSFYPVAWWDWRDLFTADARNASEVMRRTEDSYAVHYYSHNLKKTEQGYRKFVMSPDQPLYKLAASHCPITEETILRPRIGVYYNRRR